MTTSIHSCRHYWSGKRIDRDGNIDRITLDKGGWVSVSGDCIILDTIGFYEREDVSPDEIILVIESFNQEVCVDVAVDDPEDVGAPIYESPADTHQVLLVRASDLEDCEKGLRIRDGGFWREDSA